MNSKQRRKKISSETDVFVPNLPIKLDLKNRFSKTYSTVKYWNIKKKKNKHSKPEKR